MRGQRSRKPIGFRLWVVHNELGYKLPGSYIELIKRCNGGIPAATLFCKGEYPVYITGIYGIDKTKPYSLCGEMGSKFWINEWGYPDIGVTVADTISGGHHMIFLDYRECKKDNKPKVALVDQEDDYNIHVICDSFEEFIKGLIEA